MLAAIFPAPLRIALAVMLIGWGLILWRGSLWIDFGSPDAFDNLYLSPTEGGFFDPESRPTSPLYPEADHTYRWSGPTPGLKIPWPLDAVPLKAQVRMTAPRPGVAEETNTVGVKARGRLEWSEQDLGSIEVNGTYQGNYYDFKLPLHLRPNLAAYELSFQADNSFRPVAADGRVLSLLVFGVRLEPDYAEFGWRGWLASFELPALLAVISFCCWGIGRALWPVGRLALWGEGTAGGLLLLSLVGWPLAAGPLYAPWSVILPFGWLLLALAELFRKRATSLPAAFVYAATLFPLLPLAQFAFGRLYLYSLNPGTVLISVYIGALSYVGAMYINSGRQRPQTFERAFVRAMLIAAVVGFAYNHFNVFQTNLYRGTDFKIYYDALQNFEDGGSLLDTAGLTLHLPPGFALISWPFVHIFGPNVNVAVLAWRVVSEFLLIPCILILLRVFGEAEPSQPGQLKPAVWFFTLNFGQVAESLGFGQYNVLILLGVCLLALWLKEGRPGLAGFGLVGPILLNIYAAILVVYFVFERQRRGWLGLAASFALCGGLIGLVVNPARLGTYLGQLEPGNLHLTPDISNQSLWGFWGRLAVGQVTGDFKGEMAGWVWLVGGLSLSGLLGLTGLVLWRNHGTTDDRERQLKLGGLTWLVVLAPLFVGFSDSLIALVGILALVVALSRPAPLPRPRWQLSLFALAYAALAYGSRNDFFETTTAGLGLLGSSYHFLAALALWGLSLSLLWQVGPESARLPA